MRGRVRSHVFMENMCCPLEVGRENVLGDERMNVVVTPAEQK